MVSWRAQDAVREIRRLCRRPPRQRLCRICLPAGRGPADQVRRNPDALELLQMAADLSYRHAARVHRAAGCSRRSRRDAAPPLGTITGSKVPLRSRGAGHPSLARRRAAWCEIVTA